MCFSSSFYLDSDGIPVGLCPICSDSQAALRWNASKEVEDICLFYVCTDSQGNEVTTQMVVINGGKSETWMCTQTQCCDRKFNNFILLIAQALAVIL